MKQFLLFLFLFGLLKTYVFSQIYYHNFGTTTISGKPYTVTPTTINSNLSSSSWTTSFTGFVDYGGSTGRALGISNSSGTPTYTLTFNVASGSQISITSFNFWRQRSTTGAQNWSLSINGTNVGSGTVPGTGASIGTTNVSNPINNLTGTITIVLSLSNASGTGTFRLDDFRLNGIVTSNNSNCATSTSLSLPTTVGATSTTGTQTTCGKLNDFPVNSFGSTLYGDGEDAVWSITVPSGGGNYQFDLGGGGTYKILSLHSSCTPNNSNVINWITTSTGTTGTFTEYLSSGTYYLWTDTWPSPACGQYSITITKLSDPQPPPVNDEISGAILLTVNEPLGYVTYTNESATLTTGEVSPGCAQLVEKDVWFKIVVPSGITALDFDTQTGVITDGGMAIYRGTPGSLTLIECDDDDGVDGLMPWIYREDFSPGETIYIRFWEYDGGTSGTFKIYVSTPQPLPIELINFSADCYENNVLVTWQTASEYNTSHYNIEKSRNGIDWQNIHTEQAAGNSNQLITYTFTDSKSINGLNYYRLNQYDLNGVYEQFGPISINCLNENGGYFSIFPNPSLKSFSIILNSEYLIGDANLIITNDLGKEIYNKVMKVEPGINFYNIDNLDVSPGIYYISVENNYYTTEVLKQVIR
jgi:hypothetical protein